MDHVSDKEAKNIDTNLDDTGVKFGDHKSCSGFRIKESDKEITNDASFSDEIRQEIERGRIAVNKSDSCNSGSRNCVIERFDSELRHNETVVTDPGASNQSATSDDYGQDHHSSIAATEINSVTCTVANTKTTGSTCEQNSYPGSSQGTEWKDSSSSLETFPITPQTLSKDPTCTFHGEALFISSNEAPIEESTSAPGIKIIANHSDSFESLSNLTSEQYLNIDMINNAATFATKTNDFESVNSSENLSIQLNIEDIHEVPPNTSKDELFVASELNQTQSDPELDINKTLKFTSGTQSFLKGIESFKGSQNLTIAHPHPLSSQIATPNSIPSLSSPLQKLTHSATLGSAPSTSSSSLQIQDPSSSPPHISHGCTHTHTQGRSIPLQFSGSSSGSSNCSHSSPIRTETTPTSQLQTKDILLAELKSIRIASITARNIALESELANKRARLEEITKDLEVPASETVRRHIKLLHDYNDIRDIGQSLIGMIAEQRGVQIGSLYNDFGVGIKD